MKRFCVSVSVMLLVFLTWGLVYAAGIRINTTPSLPLGVYQLTNELLVKGAYVLFCPPPTAIFTMARARGYVGAGYCPGGYGHLMKRLVASKDDTVIINAEGVLINDRLLPSSAAIQKDGLGRELPHYEGSWVLGDYEVLLMSDSHKGAFDGRYFGSIQLSQIEGVLRPLFTW